MLRLTIALAACLAFAAVSSTASAVTVELSSPQEGATLSLGDTLTLTMTVTNDAAVPDRVVARVSVDIGGTILGCQGTGALQANLAPGESASKTVTLTIPKCLVITGPVPGTASVEAISRQTGAVATDSLGFTVAP